MEDCSIALTKCMRLSILLSPLRLSLRQAGGGIAPDMGTPHDIAAWQATCMQVVWASA